MGALRTAVKAAKAINKATTKAAQRPRGRVLAAAVCPPDQCAGCGRRVKPNPDPDMPSHCNRPACVRTVAARL